ncbi:MAG: S-layer homology domain-containing protein [Oscillospiraceae bacterium]|nr:S-layer homology domain-containing protein [Oscillospiraceae bacterium]
MKVHRRVTALLLALTALPLMSVRGAYDVAAISLKTASYIALAVPAPTCDGGAEWAVLALARTGYAVPDGYFDGYYNDVAKFLRAHGGVLSDRKYTEYSRVILALASAGYDPRDVAGYDLTLPLGDFDKTVSQGINGAAWALIALDASGLPIPANRAAKTQATRELYIAEILRRQLPDGRFNLTGDAATAANQPPDPDVTGMAVQALAPYRDTPEVARAIDRAIAFLSKVQNDDGGYTSREAANSESAAQVLLALSAVGISPSDKRFTKNGVTLLDALLAYGNDDGSFNHLQTGTTTLMTAEQALIALDSVRRAESGRVGTFNFSDVPARKAPQDTSGSTARHKDVTRQPVTVSGATFADVRGLPCQAAVEALAARGIVNGKTPTGFSPDDTMTRAEFAVITARALGLPSPPPKLVDPFADVRAGHWFHSGVNTAYIYGIVKGVSANAFNPDGIITREEAAVMVARAAKLCGIDTDRAGSEITLTLALFDDYRAVSDWARESLAFCYSSGVLSDDAMEIMPSSPAPRGDVAVMVYNVLRLGDLL